MNRFVLTLIVLFATLTMNAQDEILQKYSEMGDMNTTVVTKNMLSRVPLDQFDMPGLSQMIQRIESIMILVSRGDKAGKKLGTKLPKQLSGKGFKTVLNTKQDGRDLTVMQSKKDPSRVVMVMYQKPQAMAVSMQGDFTNLEADLEAITSQK
ncbi:MAG: DUF4252 domain-containing protein [Bacteroidaceae bacterium]|nr:DUF4252 domain-containing protein [Bacteroidaceae bacterium]